MSCILITSDRKEAAEAADAVGEEAVGDHSDDTGDGDTGGEGVDYDNTRDDDHTFDTRVDDANRCNAREEWENQN